MRRPIFATLSQLARVRGIDIRHRELRKLSPAALLLAGGKRILSDGATSESALVRKLIELRARRDVQSARLASTQDKIKQQTADLTVQGANVRGQLESRQPRFQLVTGPGG
jgi:hypothetical protein